MLRPGRRWLLALMMALSLGLGFAGATANADSDGERRVRTGARLFRALLAADLALDSKIADDGALHVAVYGSDPRLADEIARLIAAPDAQGRAMVRGIPIRVVVLPVLPADSGAPMGLFLASLPGDDKIDPLVRWGIRNKAIVYSPFEGHVERGVTAGLSIQAKVQPYVNRATLEASGVRLKPFFLKVAKVRE